ncbi:hypothetical protein AVDCRST_MAG94-1278 [uncultured Leptolyngbya sp.]|uniref:Uncharacterized protein n=1 Tax=uncultured Leptolyngbya sp. TaxID=332963 RepID=A0A6J4KXR7_9CYAN|nr:hypothetical protein AVDCRST_MAG94-1278 [uncultured Leptolyngbya sp.]
MDAQQTSKAEVQRSVRSLEAIGAPTLGTVVSNAKSKNSLR